MDAVQMLMIAAVPSGLAPSGSAPQPVQAETGVSRLFRFIFEEAAVAQGDPSPERERQTDPMEAAAQGFSATAPALAWAAGDKAPATGSFPGMKGGTARKEVAQGTKEENAMMEDGKLLEVIGAIKAENPSGTGVKSGSVPDEEATSSGAKEKVEKGKSETKEAATTMTGGMEAMSVGVPIAPAAGRETGRKGDPNRVQIEYLPADDGFIPASKIDPKHEGPCESVHRQLPSGFTVRNPAVTAATENRGASEITVTRQAALPGASFDDAGAGTFHLQPALHSAPAAAETVAVLQDALEASQGRLEKMVIPGRDVRSETGSREEKQDVTVDKASRQLSSGVTVPSPSRKTMPGNLPWRDAAAIPPEGEPEGRVVSREAERAVEHLIEKPVEAVAQKNEPSTTGGGMERRQGPDAGEVPRTWQVAQSSLGEAEKTSRQELRTAAGQASGETGSRLHGEILSQVSDRLADPALAAGGGRIRLKLNPGELGELQLNVRMEDRRMSVEVTSSNPVVKEALIQNLDQLKDTLSRQNIVMERFEVSTGTGHQENGQSFRDGRRPEQRQSEQTHLNSGRYLRQEPDDLRIAGWEPGESRLVDMRL